MAGSLPFGTDSVPRRTELRPPVRRFSPFPKTVSESDTGAEIDQNFDVQLLFFNLLLFGFEFLLQKQPVMSWSAPAIYINIIGRFPKTSSETRMRSLDGTYFQKKFPPPLNDYYAINLKK